MNNLLRNSLLGAFCLAPMWSFAKKPQKNIIFLAIDDLRTELGCFGNKNVKTPNIDKFASEAVAFQRAYCNIPVSGASRASLLTGTRPTRGTFLVALTYAERDKPDMTGLNDYLQANGYHTEVRGKIYHFKDDHEKGWTRFNREPANYSVVPQKSGVKPAPYECYDIPDERYGDGSNVEYALKDLERLSKSDKPFFYALGLIRPHLPFNAPKKYWDMYDRNDIKLPDNYHLKPGNNIPKKALHPWHELRNYATIPTKGPLTDEQAITLIHGYRACVSYVDALLGKVFDQIKKLGLDKNTMIVLWGDHGWSLGEHSIWCKHTMFETMLHAPLIIYDPSSKINGQNCNQIVEYVDIFPTVCDAAGIPAPKQAEGQSLMPLLKDKNAKSKGYAISRWKEGFTLVTDDNLFYTEWWDKDDKVVGKMLFDHNNDPDENYNVVNKPKYKERVAEMSKFLKANRGADFDKYPPHKVIEYFPPHKQK